jgi:CMP-N-acetylneuraminic acid synthetase
MTQWNLVVARAGSKGCPDKAIRPLPDGSTCLTRAIDIALTLSGRALLSTDYSPESFYLPHGVTYIGRPALLAHDDAPILGTIIHAMAVIDAGMDDTVVLLQATSPLRTIGTVQGAIDGYQRARSQNPPVADTVCTAMAVPLAYHPAYTLGMGPMPQSRHDLAPTYRPDGGAYVTSVRQILTGNFGRLAWIVSPEQESLSIDSEQDFAEVVRRIAAGV